MHACLTSGGSSGGGPVGGRFCVHLYVPEGTGVVASERKIRAVES